MTVFDLLGRVPDDSRVLELAEPLAALDAELPVIAPGEYRGGHPGLVGEPQEVAMRSQAQQPDAHRHQQCQPHDGAIEYRPEATRQAAQLDRSSGETRNRTGHTGTGAPASHPTPRRRRRGHRR